MAFRIFIIVFLLFFLSLLYWFMSREEAQSREQLTVFAASSFAYVLREEKAGVEDALGIDLLISEAASSTLARQIAEGAPADVFISADRAWLGFLDDRGVGVSAPRVIAQNRLSVVFEGQAFQEFCRARFFAPPNAPDLLTACPFGGKTATGDPDFVPLGKYAAKALENNGLDLNLVPAASAAAARALLETGAVDAAILYQTDIKNLGEGYVSFPFPRDPDQPILYFAVALKQSNSPATENFLDFLKSEAFKTILRTKGFEDINEAT